jgi:uncharacterized protein YndB with AHSA1/START domain
MSVDRIERDTLIAAPLEWVWSMVAVPGFWMADEASMAVEAESAVAKNTVFSHFPVRVEKVEPPTYVAYRWATAFSGQELREDNSTLVEFTLAEEGDKTRLRVVESGFAALAASVTLRSRALRSSSAEAAERDSR